MLDVSGLHGTAPQVERYARIKRYPGGGFEIMAASSPIFREAGWEYAEPPRGGAHVKASRREPSGEPEAVARSMRRARSALRDKALCTPMKYFVTLTLSPEKVADRHDIGALVKLLRGWLSNRVQRNGLAYVLVPERHKDGALHLHGLMTEGLKLVDSGTVKPRGGNRPRKPRSARQREAWLADGGQIVYNVADWELGFSTALELQGDYEAAVAYVCKYIGKDLTGGKIGGRWYFSGGELGKPNVTLCDIRYDDLRAVPGAYETMIGGERWGFALAIVRGHGEIPLVGGCEIGRKDADL